MKLELNLQMDNKWFLILILFIIVLFLCIITFNSNKINFITVESYTNCTTQPPSYLQPYFNYYQNTPNYQNNPMWCSNCSDPKCHCIYVQNVNKIS